MSKQLENSVDEYLEEVTMQIGSLPAVRREEELREICQHLHEAVAVRREQGLSEKQAVAAALTRFGTPEEAAESVIGAWRRDVQRHERVMGLCQFFYILVFVIWHPAAYGALCCWVSCFTGVLITWVLLPRKYHPRWMYRLLVKV